jgi:glucose/arabinose dehydrogenase/PKD repeat protein
LVAAYNFEEGTGTTTADASGNGNTGSLLGASWTSSGKYGKGLAFNGTSARVDVASSASLQLTSAMTLEAWVNPTTVSSAWRDVIMKGNDNYYLMATSSSGGRPLAGTIVGGSYAEAIGPSGLPTGTFSHLAATYDGSTLRLYINGSQVASTARSGLIVTSTSPLQLGGDSVYGQFFAGVLDEIRIYNTALSATQIQTDMTTPIGSPPPPPPPADFVNEVLATDFELPTTIEFLPDGRMLVVELQGTIRVLPPPYTQPDPAPFLQLTNVGQAGVQQGVYDIVLDPSFTTNRHYYVFYTLGTPNRDRVSRFTANATLTGTVAGSELVLYQDPLFANEEHHGGALSFGADGKLYFTTGEHFIPASSQDLTSPRGKLHRINPDGTVPTDGPFYDGAGPNWDSIWAHGLRNPFRTYYDAPTDRLFIGDVGGNTATTAIEELDLGARGADYGWPNVEGSCTPPCVSPIFSYAHNGRDACITAGFVYHGSQFPSTYVGSFFFADYSQNWIKRLTFDAAGNVSGVHNFEPADGGPDGPTGDIVALAEGPDGALYYVDLGYSDTTDTSGISKIRRIRYVAADQPPVAAAAANPTAGAAPLSVTFSSAGSFDPEGQTLSYLWTFGDGATSTQANPVHTYAQAGQYSARLSVSDSTNTTLSAPLTIAVGDRPTATILTPADGATFRAGDVISFSGDGTDPTDGSLPASAFTWNIDFLHEGHVHPGAPLSEVKSGSFTIPTSGHDFSGNTRYRITLTVTDSTGLTDARTVTVFPQKVNVTFRTVPAGLTLYLDGIARATPFSHDTLIGFNHTIEARNQTSGATTYTFLSWSDGGAQTHTIAAPTAPQEFVATYNQSTPPAPPTFVQVNSTTPQTNQSVVSLPFTAAQTAGNLNILAIGWNDATSTITSVSDSAGNSYQVAAATSRGIGLSQAIYYARNISGAAAGANVITVTFNTAVPFADIRILEYAGLDAINPFDRSASAAGTTTLANSGNVTTTSATELVFGAGMTIRSFITPGTGFTTRVITNPDGDIAEDRFVSSVGTYNATATQYTTGSWLMQVATFRAPGQ